jgi:hypothetical protein
MANLPNVRTSLGPVKPHVLKVAEEVTSLWPIYYLWGAPGRGTGDHAKGLALDFMAYDLGAGVDRPGPIREFIGWEISSYLLEHHERLNLSYIIWNRRIASAKSGWEWRPYDGDDPHTNHVHASFKPTGTYRPVAPEIGDDDMQLSDHVSLLRPDGKREWAGTVLGADRITVDGALGLAAAAGRQSGDILKRLDKQNELLTQILAALKASGGKPS